VQDVATSYNSSGCRDAILIAGPRPEIRFAAQGTSGQIDALKRALSLFHAFGGIGARSRRGWGSVEIEAEGVAPIPSAAQLPSHLAQVVEGALGSSLASIPRPRFSAFSSETRLFLTAPMGSADAVLVEFAQRLLAERSFYRTAPRAVADHALETSDLALPAASSITGIPSRLAFGMPFHPKHDKVWEMEYRGRLPGSPDDVTRRASPLLLKVLRTADDRYVGAALFLQADFFGDPSREIGEKNKLLTVPFGPAEYQVVEDFLNGTGWTNVPL
jgi:CRISPR-associated protein Cmr1